MSAMAVTEIVHDEGITVNQARALLGQTRESLERSAEMINRFRTLPDTVRNQRVVNLGQQIQKLVHTQEQLESFLPAPQTEDNLGIVGVIAALSIGGAALVGSMTMWFLGHREETKRAEAELAAEQARIEAGEEPPEGMTPAEYTQMLVLGQGSVVSDVAEKALWIAAIIGGVYVIKLLK